MCTLDAAESKTIIDAIEEISVLASRASECAATIAATAYMDHEGLAEVLARLQERAAFAGQWVTDKPRQHAGHASH
jgi:hypothetical protein